MSTISTRIRMATPAGLTMNSARGGVRYTKYVKTVVNANCTKRMVYTYGGVGTRNVPFGWTSAWRCLSERGPRQPWPRWSGSRNRTSLKRIINLLDSLIYFVSHYWISFLNSKVNDILCWADSGQLYFISIIDNKNLFTKTYGISFFQLERKRGLWTSQQPPVKPKETRAYVRCHQRR